MRTIISTFIAAILIFTNFSFAVSANPKLRAINRAKTNQLVAMLPESEAVVTVDIKRLFGEAMPIMLSSKPTMVADISSKIEQMRASTGVDIRKFDLVVAGVNAKRIETKVEDKVSSTFIPEAVMIARGEVDSAAVINAAKTASDNKYKEESLGGKIIYVFSAKDIAEKIKEKVAKDTTANKVENTEKLNKILGMDISDMAISAVDANTIAFGNVERVRAAVEGKTKMSSQVTSLLNRKQFSIINFAAKSPAGISDLLPIENDDLGKSIESIRYAFGNMDVVENNAVFGVTAKTQQSTHAQGLFDTLDVFQALGKMLLGSSKRPDQQLYARLLEQAKLSRSGTEVSLDIQVPKADMDILMGILIK